MGRKVSTARLTNELWSSRQEVESIKRYCDSLYKEHAAHFETCNGGVHCHQHEEKYKSKSQALRHQAKYVTHMEQELKALKGKYEIQINKIKVTASCLEKELTNVRSELKRIVSKADSADKLSVEVQLLRDKVNRRDQIIERYKSKYGRVCKMVKSIENKCVSNSPKMESGDGRRHNNRHHKKCSSSSDNNEELKRTTHANKFAHLPNALHNVAKNKSKVDKKTKR